MQSQVWTNNRPHKMFGHKTQYKCNILVCKLCAAGICVWLEIPRLICFYHSAYGRIHWRTVWSQTEFPSPDHPLVWTGVNAYLNSAADQTSKLWFWFICKWSQLQLSTVWMQRDSLAQKRANHSDKQKIVDLWKHKNLVRFCASEVQN